MPSGTARRPAWPMTGSSASANSPPGSPLALMPLATQRSRGTMRRMAKVAAKELPRVCPRGPRECRSLEPLSATALCWRTTSTASRSPRCPHESRKCRA